MLLSEQIQKLERREKALSDLCQDMINTIKLNIDRGHIQFQNLEHKQEVLRWLENWSIAKETA